MWDFFFLFISFGKIRPMIAQLFYFLLIALNAADNLSTISSLETLYAICLKTIFRCDFDRKISPVLLKYRKIEFHRRN